MQCHEHGVVILCLQIFNSRKITSDASFQKGTTGEAVKQVSTKMYWHNISYDQNLLKVRQSHNTPMEVQGGK
jgi:hypothetical protein